MNKNYDKFITEQLIIESIKTMKFVLSKRFIEVISKINSDITDELLSSHANLDFDTKQTFIDINEESDDSVTFILANKAAQLLNITTEEELNNLNLKRTLRDMSGNQEVYRKFRGSMKLGRFINNIYPNKFPASLRLEHGEKIKDVENFIRLYKTLTNQDEKFAMFDVVSGSDISKWYNYKRYLNRNGSMGSSCMSEVDEDYFNIYVWNPEVVRLVILFGNPQKTKIKGRAILWNTTIPEGKIFMDRIYTNDSSDEQLFIEFAKKNKWLYKGRQSFGSNYGIVDSETDTIIRDNIKIQVKIMDYEYYPYMDTVPFYNSNKGTLSNSERGANYELLSTGGDRHELDFDDSEVYSRYHGHDIYQREAKWCQIGEDYVLSNEAIRVFNTGLGSEVYAVPGSPGIVRCLIPDVSIDKYFPERKCIWSDYLKTWIFKDSSIKVYTNKEKSDFNLDHKKRENKTFVKIDNNYYDISLVTKNSDGTYELK